MDTQGEEERVSVEAQDRVWIRRDTTRMLILQTVCAQIRGEKYAMSCKLSSSATALCCCS